MKKKTTILRTHIPFMPRIRVLGESVAGELYDEILKCSKEYNKPVSRFSAEFEILPDPEGGHFMISQVTYLEGKLK